MLRVSQLTCTVGLSKFRRKLCNTLSGLSADRTGFQTFCS